MTKRVIFDIFLLLSLLVFPLMAYKINFVKNIDDIVILFMAIIVIFKLLYKYTIEKSFMVVLFLFICYSMFLLFYNHLPLRNFLQVYIYLKFIIIFLYYYLNNDFYKVLLFNKLMNLILILFIMSIFISFIQFIIPDYFHKDLSRGIHGITLRGVFFGRIIFGEFLVVFIILLMGLRKASYMGINKIYVNYRYSILFIALLMLFLTFDRKELILILGLLLFLFKDKVKKESKIIFYLMVFVVLALFLVFFYLFFYDLNKHTFVAKQIRWIIFLEGMKVFIHYFPFGSGPGTYGSIMSLKYLDVYEQFDVPKNIYFGWHGNRGPIFDVFIISLIAEYGVGFLFFFYFLYKMHSFKINLLLNMKVNIKTIKISFFIVFLLLIPFVPIILNWIGFLMLMILALFSSKNQYQIKIIDD